MTYKITVNTFGIIRKFLVDAPSEKAAMQKVKKTEGSTYEIEIWTGTW